MDFFVIGSPHRFITEVSIGASWGFPAKLLLTGHMLHLVKLIHMITD